MPENIKKKLPRIVFLASELTVREYPTFLGRLLIGLAEEAVPVALVLPSKCNPDRIFTAHAEIIRYPVVDLPLMAPLNIRLLIERLKKFEPNVLHCLCQSKALLAKQLSHRLNLPYVLTVNSLYNRRRQPSISSTHCARIVVPAKSIADNMTKSHPRFADRIEQVNIGAFVSETAVCFSDPARLASMVVAQSLDNADGFEKFFNAIRRMNIDGYEFMMVAALGGKADRQIWKLLAALGLLQIVTIVPKSMPKRAVLGAADIFIQPQASRIFDPLLLEAMSAGCAVAASKGGVEDLIIEDKTAVVFDSNDEVSIMRCLRRLLDRREFARQIGRNSQEYLKENHKVSRMVSKTLQIYEDAILWPRNHQ